MRNLYTKIPVIIGMIFNGIAVVLFLIMPDLINNIAEALVIVGTSLFMFIISLFLYLTDAVLSIVKAIKGIYTIFNIILAVVIIGIIPMLMFVIFSKELNREIFALVHILLIFLLEIVSIITHIKREKTDE